VQSKLADQSPEAAGGGSKRRPKKPKMRLKWVKLVSVSLQAKLGPLLSAKQQQF
jgi:hypothetical protein